MPEFIIALPTLIAWLFVMVITSEVAMRKGYSGLLWAILGALFSLLALLAIAAMPAKPRAS